MLCHLSHVPRLFTTTRSGGHNIFIRVYYSVTNELLNNFFFYCRDPCPTLQSLVCLSLLAETMTNGRKCRENQWTCRGMVSASLHDTLIPIGRYCPTNIIQADPYTSQGSGWLSSRPFCIWTTFIWVHQGSWTLVKLGFDSTFENSMW